MSLDKAEYINLNAGTARRSVAIILVSTTALAIGLLFFISLTYFKSLDREAAATRLLLYEQSLNDTLARYQYFPFVLAQDLLIKGALAGAPRNALNQRLEQFADKAGLEAIYLMDISGSVLAASNFNQPHSFVGQNYGFRPYFKQAINGERGNYFGVGVTTGRPGYFVSEPIIENTGQIIGVIAIKLDVSALQKRWETGGENVLASNSNGIVILSSNRDLLFGSLNDLSAEFISATNASKQFGNKTLTRLPWQITGPASVRQDDKSYIYSHAEVKHLGWKIHYLLSEGRAYERALLTTIVFGSSISILVGFATYLRSKRIQVALARSQSDRDLLLSSNAKLEQAHNDLARSSKLAALGQLSVSVVHELGQPISALRNYLTAEEISSSGTPHPNQAKLNGVVDRMESITKQLRFFGKPSDHSIERLALNDVVLNAIDLVQHDLEVDKINLQTQIENHLYVIGNKFRLEQVLVNLLMNALHSLREAAKNDLSIALMSDKHNAIIRIMDNGVGFGDRQLAQLQEPFHTTRSSGDGMGLGLSIATAIIKEHNGDLSAKNAPNGGAVFVINLPMSLKPNEAAS